MSLPHGEAPVPDFGFTRSNGFRLLSNSGAAHRIDPNSMRSGNVSIIVLLSLGGLAYAQEPAGTLEGEIQDASGAAVSAAVVSVTNRDTGFAIKQLSTREGSFHFASLPAGEYDLGASAVGFAPFTASAIRIDIGRTVRAAVKLEVAAGHSEVSVTAAGATVDSGTALGDVVSAREATDLPLNGRDFAQLGLLQSGVAPMTGGLAEAGGLARANQGYAVNGQRTALPTWTTSTADSPSACRWMPSTNSAS